MRFLLTSFHILVLVLSDISIAYEPLDQAKPADIATLPRDDGPGYELVDLRDWHANHRVVLMPPLRNYTRAYLDSDPQRLPIRFEIKPDVSTITLELPALDDKSKRSNVRLESVEKTRQNPDGRITFSALDAEVVGPEGM